MSAGLIPLKSEVAFTTRCPDWVTQVKILLLELDSILHALSLAFCHELTLKKFLFVSVMGLVLHTFCIPFFSP